MSEKEGKADGDTGDDPCKTDKSSEEEEKLGGPQFLPRLYLQRYYFVQQELSKLKAEKIVDFGSAECRIGRFLIQIPTAIDIFLVDIDRTLLEQSKWCIRPMTCDYIIKRERPLSVKILEGSVTQYDSRLEKCDVVTMVEIIEHLVPDVLAAAVVNVFGNINPRAVVLTTPNADFNVLFPNFSGFRHWDHKFEWTRTEFQQWCTDIASRYDYTVEYSGIGQAPADSTHLGCCSQAAVFTRKSTVKTQLEEGTSVDSYSLIAECSYPYQTVIDSVEDKLLQEIEFILRQFQTDNQYEDYDSNCLVPVTTLLRFKQINSEFTENKLRDYLRNHGYRISADGEMVIIPAIHRHSNSDGSDNDCDVVTIEGRGEDMVHNFEEGQSCSDIEFWD